MKKQAALIVILLQLFSMLPARADGDYCLLPTQSPPRYTSGFSEPTAPSDCSTIRDPQGACQHYADALHSSDPNATFVASVTNDGGFYNPYTGLTTDQYIALYGPSPYPIYGGGIGWLCSVTRNGLPYVQQARMEVTGCQPTSCPAQTHFSDDHSMCINDKATNFDNTSTAAGITVSRDSNGVVTSVLNSSGEGIIVTASDNVGRVIAYNTTGVDGYSATVTYYPGRDLVYQLTTSDGVNTFLWNEDDTLARMYSADHMVYVMEYTPQAKPTTDIPQLANIRVQTSRGDCGTGRSGTLVPFGVPTTPIIMGALEEPGGLFAGAMTESATPVQQQIPFAMVVVVQSALMIGLTYVAAKVMAPTLTTTINAIGNLCHNWSDTPEGKKHSAYEECRKNGQAAVTACYNGGAAPTPGQPKAKLYIPQLRWCLRTAYADWYKCNAQVEKDFPGVPDPEY